MARRSDQELIGKVWCERYQILEYVGRGGMGTVFKARQLQIDREVALKVIHRKLTQDEKQVKRFEREARASSKLQHPNNIRVYDYGTGEDGRLFIAMEFLRGETLADLIGREGTLPPERTIHVTKQICKALAEAHQLGLVHRDLKPENIFLTEVYGERDFVKILDFGIAKSLTGNKEAADLTQTGFICGTPRYISPEQALGQPVDGRADLYAVAVLMYEMLSGRPPFLGDNPISIVMKHVYDDPPPLTGMERFGPLGKRLVTLIDSLLEKNPARRPDSAERVLGYLDGRFDVSELGSRRPAGDPPPPATEKIPSSKLPSFDEAVGSSRGGAAMPPPMPGGGGGGEATAMMPSVAAAPPGPPPMPHGGGGGGGEATAVMQRPEDLRSFVESGGATGEHDPEAANATMMLDAGVASAAVAAADGETEGATRMMSQEVINSALKDHKKGPRIRQNTGLVRRSPRTSTDVVHRRPGARNPSPAGPTGPELSMRRRSGTPTWALVASGVAISVIILAVFAYVMATRNDDADDNAQAVEVVRDEPRDETREEPKDEPAAVEAKDQEPSEEPKKAAAAEPDKPAEPEEPAKPAVMETGEAGSVAGAQLAQLEVPKPAPEEAKAQETTEGAGAAQGGDKPEEPKAGGDAAAKKPDQPAAKPKEDKPKAKARSTKPKKRKTKPRSRSTKKKKKKKKPAFNPF